MAWTAQGFKRLFQRKAADFKTHGELSEVVEEVVEESELFDRAAWPPPPPYLQVEDVNETEAAQHLLEPLEAEEDLEEKPSTRADGFTRERQFWRWTGALGWSLNLILLCWALFLRKAGLVNQGQAEEGLDVEPAQSLKMDTTTYADLVASQLQEERYVSESNNALGTILAGLGSKLESLRSGAERLMKPTDEALPRYDDVMLSRLISDLQAGIEDQLEILGNKDAEVLEKLQQKPEILRQLADEPVPSPERPNNGLLPEELPQFVEQSLVPIVIILGSSFLVAVLSRQFLRVVTEWRRSREETKAERMRKIQKRRFQAFTGVFNGALENLATGQFTEAAKSFDQVANFANRWASEPTWEELVRAEIAAFWERWGPQAYRLEANIGDWTGVPQSSTSEQFKWVADRWFTSAQSVVKDFAFDAVKAWGEEASRAASAARRAARLRSKAPPDRGRGLVIRIFGRWPAPEDWVNIANLPLAGDWREQALRLLLPSAKDVQDPSVASTPRVSELRWPLLVLSLNFVFVASSHFHKHVRKADVAQTHSGHHRSQLRRSADSIEEALSMDEEVIRVHRDKLQQQQEEFAKKEANTAPSLAFTLRERHAADQEESQSDRYGGMAMEAVAAVQSPISAKLTKEELEKLLAQLSPVCHKQFQAMLQGHGKARDLHHFGNSSQNAAETCSTLGGALCENHARILQTNVVADGRKMVAKSMVDGNSCLPRKCIQDSDLRLLAGMLQRKAVEALGPASVGQQPVEVLLDVDCTSSGGSSYSATREWSMERAGPARSSSVQTALSSSMAVLLAWQLF
ncbi:unnamed protein product [Symbiodinium pilosum]|uniref:Uncharacterized protein n=1 Tax=Symbiodinium pilosum TaxID=2952 RepID=A0A812SNM6_SYMPI|nr:unnamed protein product [Symbiodinium pilosum]